jgi:cell division protein FtsQ
MTSLSPVSRAELAQRRKKLRWQRRWRFLQASWRTLAVVGLTGGVVWSTTLPIWVLATPDQIKIEGNQFLTVPTLRSLLPITYPQSVLRVEPQKLIETLKTKAPIAEATVDRQLFPPRLTIKVRERNPVAIVLPPRTQPAAIAAIKDIKSLVALGEKTSDGQTGLLDENGMWIPLESYASLNQALKLPTLKVLGKPEQYRPYWIQLYQALKQSPVKIRELDWSNPGNLILKTEIGPVHCGSYSQHFADQLRTLGQMRRLPSHADYPKVAYIDLKSPEYPIVQFK